MLLLIISLVLDVATCIRRSLADTLFYFEGIVTIITFSIPSGESNLKTMTENQLAAFTIITFICFYTD